MNNIPMASIQSPCLNCSDRKVGCHSKCDKYLKFVKEKDEVNRKIRYKNYMEWIGK